MCNGALSENAIQKWFDKSSMSILWKFPHKLTCQNFLNHYKYIDHETSKKIEDDLCKILIEKGITPKILFLDHRFSSAVYVPLKNPPFSHQKPYDNNVF
jgi:transposase